MYGRGKGGRVERGGPLRLPWWRGEVNFDHPYLARDADPMATT